MSRSAARCALVTLTISFGFLSSIGRTDAAPPRTGRPFVDKTMVVWATLDHADQNVGVMTLENPPSEFDALVLGEIRQSKWMVGSDYFRRTERNQEGYAVENATRNQVLQLAIVYEGRHVTLYRNGQLYADYQMPNDPIAFTTSSRVLFGLHHSDTIGAPCFTGSIDDARIYDRALSTEQIKKLRPDDATGPEPLAWWSFDDNRERQGSFPAGQTVGQAKVRNGKLELSGGFFAVNIDPMPQHEDEDWPIYHLHARKPEGHARPYDANGCFYKDGVYHLMYIFQDRRRPREGHSWGHCTSTDLVNWTYQRPALQPELQDPDVGIYSGNAFVGPDGKMRLCWFGVDSGVCVATAGNEDLTEWKKHPLNPVIPIPKEGNAVLGKSAGRGKYFVWDPFMWCEGDTYYCLLGGNALPNGKDTLFLMKSDDLVNWQPLHPFYEHPDPTWTVPGEDCSCPDFFSLGKKHVLMCISHSVGARCYVGEYRDERFFPEQHIRMNWPGGNLFAPESLVDNNDRRLFWAWITDPRTIAAQVTTGSGVMSLPRVLSLAEGNRLAIHPASELESLRRNHQKLRSTELIANREIELGIHGKHLELDLAIECGDAREIGIRVRCSSDGQEATEIVFSPVEQSLSIDCTKSTLRRDVVYSYHPLDTGGLRLPRGETHPCPVTTAPLRHSSFEPLRLRVFLDGPVLEVYAGEFLCLTQQIFPSRSDSIHVRAIARGGSGKVIRGDVWEMAAATFDEAD